MTHEFPDHTVSDFRPGEHVRFTADAPAPYADLHAWTFTVERVTEAGLHLSGLHLDLIPALTLDVPPPSVKHLRHSSVWPVLCAAFPDTFRIVPRRGGPGERLEMASVHGGRFAFAAEVVLGDQLPDEERGTLRMEGVLRSLLAECGWPLRLDISGDDCTVSLGLVLTADPQYAGPLPRPTGYADHAALAVARALRLAVELDDAYTTQVKAENA